MVARCGRPQGRVTVTPWLSLGPTRR